MTSDSTLTTVAAIAGITAPSPIVAAIDVAIPVWIDSAVSLASATDAVVPINVAIAITVDSSIPRRRGVGIVVRRRICVRVGVIRIRIIVRVWVVIRERRAGLRRRPTSIHATIASVVAVHKLGALLVEVRPLSLPISTALRQ